MIVVDTSAIVAIDRREPQAFTADVILYSTDSIIASPTVLELTMVLSRFYGEDAIKQVNELLQEYAILVAPFDKVDLEEAQLAFLRYGKGRHPARLNSGDCVSYALAKRLGAPLLYVGEDFGLTDVQSALS